MMALWGLTAAWAVLMFLAAFVYGRSVGFVAGVRFSERAITRVRSDIERGPNV